jgi:putative Holliday junction resolvase
MSPVGRVLGLDHGAKRVGVAISDPLGISAQGLEVVPRSQAVERVVELANEYQVTRIVIGLPVSLGGGETASAEAARRFAIEVEAVTGLAVVMVDERYTTATAQRVMLEAGVKRRKRRESIDKVAATVILQSFLDR